VVTCSTAISPPPGRHRVQARRTVDKFIGDAIMAFWGAPLPDERQAERAVQAALEMRGSPLNSPREVGDRGVNVRKKTSASAIHSGPAVVGFIGSENKTDYTRSGIL